MRTNNPKQIERRNNLVGLINPDKKTKAIVALSPRVKI